MKKLLFLTLLFITNVICANEVSLKCWEMGLPQTEDYIIYKNDGSTTQEDYILFDDMLYDLVQLEAKIECATSELKKYCQDFFYHPQIGHIEIHLKQSTTYINGTQAMVGKMKESVERNIYCERKVL